MLKRVSVTETAPRRGAALSQRKSSERTAEIGRRGLRLLGRLRAGTFQRRFRIGIFRSRSPRAAHLFDRASKRRLLRRRNFGADANFVFCQEIVASGNSDCVGRARTAGDRGKAESQNKPVHVLLRRGFYLRRCLAPQSPPSM